jgi:DNA-directed RNA polymerase sigma subunit (sigma70/sigma32)
VRLNKSRRMDENLRAMVAFASPGYTYTLDDIAEVIGCSKERVRQIQDSALRKLRRRTDYLKKEIKKQ